ncbi:MAG: M1 family aminopeptidase [Terriglobales bacterium]
MSAWVRCLLLSGIVVFAVPLSLPAAENPAPAPNSDPFYQQLRNLMLSSEAVGVSNFTLHRDVGTFLLRSGTVCFVGPVNGKVTGAAFNGEGSFVLDPGLNPERKSLKLLTKEDNFNETFNQAVFRFTDATYDEIKKAGGAGAGGCDAGLLKDTQNTTRHKFKSNMEARLLVDVLSPEAGGYFAAFIHGRRYSGKELFEIDPNKGSDQVHFSTYEDNKAGEWMALNLFDRRIVAGHPSDIKHLALDVTFEKGGNLEGKATAEIVALRNGLRVVPLNLFPSLRVQRVSVDGQAATFIQENKNEDADFAVVLPRPLKAGEKFPITTTYAGKDAVINTGDGNYYPVARDDWYPNQPDAEFGHYALYDMTLRIPKGMKMAATGALVSETNEGGQNVTVWKSEAPQTVAGFSFGRFKEEQKKLDRPEYLIQSYANEVPPDWVKGLQQRDLDNLANGVPTIGDVARPDREVTALHNEMSTASLNKKALAEGQLAAQLYSDYFGPSLFKHLQITQQTACSYGQSWPELVWLPVCYYFDTTVRHSLSLDNTDKGYWKVVTAHEVAHQWWGNTVGFAAGRDQWMSEGFADESASLYVSLIEKNPKKFLEFWKDEQELLLERNAQGFRAIDVGPVTLGYRASNTRTGNDVTERLIYPKGAFILHMVRMMMWDRKTGDQNFRDTMHDLVKTYSGKAATTEDFKAMIEKHMTPEMDLDGNHRLDWFFDEYVYGTALPSYKMDYSFGKDPNGQITLDFKIEQSGVSDRFKMLVPIYLELPDGRMVNLGRARLFGNTTASQKVPLSGLKEPPKRAVLNYNYDVLADK